MIQADPLLGHLSGKQKPPGGKVELKKKEVAMTGYYDSG